MKEFFIFGGVNYWPDPTRHDSKINGSDFGQPDQSRLLMFFYSNFMI
jgi:hypothetical protein